MKKTISFLTQSALTSIFTLTAVHSSDQSQQNDRQKILSEQLARLNKGIPGGITQPKQSDIDAQFARMRHNIPGGLTQPFQPRTTLNPSSHTPSNANFEIKPIGNLRDSTIFPNAPLLSPISYLQYPQPAPLNFPYSNNFLQPQSFMQQSSFNFAVEPMDKPKYPWNETPKQPTQHEQKKIVTRSQAQELNPYDTSMEFTNMFVRTEKALLSSGQTEADYNTAYKMFDLIALQEKTPPETKEKALFELMKFNYSGLGMDKSNYKKAREYADTILNKLNNPDVHLYSLTQYYKAIMDFKGYGLDKPNYDNALKGFSNVLTKATIDQRCLIACCIYLADIYKSGLGNQPVDFTKSRSYLAMIFNHEKASFEQKIASFLKLTQINIKEKVSLNYSNLRNDLNKIALMENASFRAEANLLLAELDYRGLDLPKPNYERAIEICEKVSLSNDADPRFTVRAKLKLLELHFSSTHGHSTNYKKAYQAGKSILESSHSTPEQKRLAYFYLARMDAYGDETHAINNEKAIEEFKHYIASPDPILKYKLRAQLELVKMAIDGKIIPSPPLKESYNTLLGIIRTPDSEGPIRIEAQLLMTETDIKQFCRQNTEVKKKYIPQFEKMRLNLTTIISDDKASPKDIIKAKYHLAQMDHVGLGIDEPDLFKAMEGYRSILNPFNSHQREVILASFGLGNIFTKDFFDYESAGQLYKNLIIDTLIPEKYRFEALFKLTGMNFDNVSYASSDNHSIRQDLIILQQSPSQNQKAYALIQLAKMDYKGIGLLTPSYDSAYKNFKKAALVEKVHPKFIAIASYWLAKMHFYGKGVAEPKLLLAWKEFEDLKTTPFFDVKRKAKICLYSTLLARIKSDFSFNNSDSDETSIPALPDYEQIIETIKAAIADTNLPLTHKLMARVELAEMAFLGQGHHEATPESLYKELSEIIESPDVTKRTLAKVQLILAQMDLSGYWSKNPNFETARSQLKGVIHNNQASSQDISKARYLLAEMDFYGKGLEKPEYLSAKMALKALLSDPNTNQEIRHKSEALLETFFEAEHLNIENESMDEHSISSLGEATVYDIKRGMEEEISNLYHPPQKKIQENYDPYLGEGYNYFDDNISFDNDFDTDNLWETSLAGQATVIQAPANINELAEIYRNEDVTRQNKRPAESEIDKDQDTKRRRTKD